MEIYIDKEKAYNRVYNGVIIDGIGWFFGLIFSYILVILFNNSMFYYSDKMTINIWVILAMVSSIAIYMLGKVIYGKYLIRSLKYTLEKDKLIKEWKVITKKKDTARLQVVNSVDIKQGLIDRLFNLFYIEVCYGFSGSGYYFRFNYLSEEEAEKVMELIKPSGKEIRLK